ncbi:MAG: dimethylsulfoniopropionate demethylase [Thiolinea sp.]
MDGLNMSRRIRRTPYTSRVEAVGVRGFSVVNHMLLPKAFQTTVEEDYWHLREHAQIWDVSCQRQVEITGPDAKALVQWMTPRDISAAQVGDCLYIPLTDENAGMINDPVLLKIADDHYWLSIADSDVLLWAKGLALGRGMNVHISEPDVHPLSVQGPKAEDLLATVFGEQIRSVGFFKYGRFAFRQSSQIIARSGYSKQGGFEIYLDNSALGEALWDTIWEAGQAFNLKPGCPNLIERIEGGLLSYGNEMTRANNPLECGLSAYCQLDGHDFIGRDALRQIAQDGVKQQMRGIRFTGPPAPVCSTPWPVMAADSSEYRQVGQITSGIYSPRLQQNVGQSMMERGFWDAGQRVIVCLPDGSKCQGEVVEMPFA